MVLGTNQRSRKRVSDENPKNGKNQEFILDDSQMIENTGEINAVLRDYFASASPCHILYRSANSPELESGRLRLKMKGDRKCVHHDLAVEVRLLILNEKQKGHKKFSPAPTSRTLCLLQGLSVIRRE